MIMACIFFAGFNYLTYANADNSKDDTTTTVCDKKTDSDCDGLTNSEEKLYGTDLNKADSDGDGYSDGVEVKSGYDPLKPAPGDKIVSAKTASSSKQKQAGDAQSLTDKFSQSVISLVSAKGNDPITTTDINNLAEQQLADNMGEPITLDLLPEIDKSQIKILKQDYAGLSEEKKTAKEIEDATNYLQKMGYLFVNNAPVPILTAADFSAFQADFFSHLTEISETGSDSEYFSDLGDRLELLLNQANEVEVPETMVDLHIKFLRLSRGLLTLQDSSENLDVNDPMGRMLFFTKVNSYLNLFSDFFKNDFQDYFENFQ